MFFSRNRRIREEMKAVERIKEEKEVEKIEEEIDEAKQIDNGFEKLTVSELREIAKERDIEAYYSLKKQELIDILKK